MPASDRRGNPSWREIPSDTPDSGLTITHDYYDHRDADRDVGIVYPLQRLRDSYRRRRAGIATVSLTMPPDLTRKVGVPRALAVRLPLGHPFGMPGRRFLQAQLLRLMRSHARTMSIPGEILDTGLGDENAPACEACGTS